MSVTNFQESILIISALKNSMQNDLIVFKRYIEDEDLKFSLNNKMLIDIASFLDEWKRFNHYAKDDDVLKETLSIASPALKRIKKWKGIQSMRNTMLAHGFRDGENPGKITCINKRYFTANVPTTYAEVMLLSEYAVYAISAVICRHNLDHEIALASIPSHELEVERGIQTMGEFEEAVSELEQYMFNKDPSLKIAFGV